MTSHPNLVEGSPSGILSLSKIYYPRPTLIIPCGNSNRLLNLRKEANSRLNHFVDDGLVRWSPPFEFKDAPPVGLLDEQVQPLLKHDLWQQLLNKGYIESLGDVSHPLRIHFLVLCDCLTDAFQESVANWLEKLSAGAETKLASRAEYDLTLLLLGDPPALSGKLRGYWPRFYLSTVGYGGTQISQEQILQVCQNVIVALVASDIRQEVDSLTAKDSQEVGWIALGASSILVDIASIWKRYELEVELQFVEPLVRGALSDAQRRLLDDAVAKKIQNFLLGLWGNQGVSGILAQKGGWQLEGKKEEKKQDKTAHQEEGKPEPVKWERDGRGPEADHCYLRPDSWIANELRRHRDLSEWWIVEGGNSRPDIRSDDKFLQKVWKWVLFLWGRIKKFFNWIPLPDHQRLTDLLAKNYCDLDKSLIEGLSPSVRAGYLDLQKTFKYLLNRGLFTAKEKSPLDLSPDVPDGLNAAVYAVDNVIKCLSEEVPDLRHNGSDVTPSRMQTERYWEECAKADAEWIEAQLRRYMRLRRSIFSPLGIILKLIVGWPLLTGLLDIFTHLEQSHSALLSALILILWGTIDLTIEQGKLRDLMRQVRKQIKEHLQDRVLSLVTKTLYDYRVLVIARLRSIRRILNELNSIVAKEYESVRNECELRARQPGNRENGALFWLVDYEKALGKFPVALPNLTEEKLQEYEMEMGLTEDEKEKRKNQANLATLYPNLRGETVFTFIEGGETQLGWVSKARSHANAEAMRNDRDCKQAEVGLIARYALPLLDKPASSNAMLKAIKELSQRLAKQEFKEQFLSINALADQDQELRDGAKWHWLFQHAHPLGDNAIAKERSLFTIMVVPEISASAGYWDQEWLAIRSRQTHELICARGVIEKGE